MSAALSITHAHTNLEFPVTSGGCVYFVCVIVSMCELDATLSNPSKGLDKEHCLWFTKA